MHPSPQSCIGGYGSGFCVAQLRMYRVLALMIAATGQVVLVQETVSILAGASVDDDATPCIVKPHANARTQPGGRDAKTTMNLRMGVQMSPGGMLDGPADGAARRGAGC